MHDEARIISGFGVGASYIRDFTVNHFDGSAWVSNYTQLFYVDVIICPCPAPDVGDV